MGARLVSCEARLSYLDGDGDEMIITIEGDGIGYGQFGKLTFITREHLAEIVAALANYDRATKALDQPASR